MSKIQSFKKFKQQIISEYKEQHKEELNLANISSKKTFTKSKHTLEKSLDTLSVDNATTEIQASQQQTSFDDKASE